MVQKLTLAASALVLALSVIAGVAWWWLVRDVLATMLDAEVPVPVLAFFVAIAVAQVFSWFTVALLCLRAWRTQSPWLVWFAPFLGLGLLLANLIFGFFTPAVGAPAAFMIGLLALALLAAARRPRVQGAAKRVLFP